MRLKRALCLLTLLGLLVAALPAAEFRANAESQYYITVDITNQIVTVYDSGNVSDSGIVRQMICSTGKNATPTPEGTFTLPANIHSSERKEWYYFSAYNCYAKWATRIKGGILFHSVLYTAKKVGPTKASTKALGSKASHGCIRLRVEDAQWIALNCPGGTACKIFKSGAKDAALRKKLLKKTFSRDEMSYEQYTGRANGAAAAVKINLSRGKKGAQVTELQNRLRALGYMSAAADGKFGSTTKVAVNAFRAACGLKQTGKVDNDVWNRLFADDAPTGTLATLVEGWQGPAVAVLQRALTDLKLFSGAVDGNFGPDTRQAVQNYQSSFNLAVDGAANTALQNDAIARAQGVKAQFGETPYQMVTSTAEVTLATVNVKSYTRMYSTASTRGKKLIRLYKNTRVKVLSDDGGSWVQIQAGGVTGYVQRKFLSIFPGTETVVNYEAVPAELPAPDAALAAPALEMGEEPVAEPAQVVAEELTIEPAQETAPEAVEEPVAEATPAPAPEETPEPEPEVTPEPAPEAVGEPAAEATPEPAPEEMPEPAAEVTPEPAPEMPEESAQPVLEPGTEEVQEAETSEAVEGESGLTIEPETP